MCSEAMHSEYAHSHYLWHPNHMKNIHFYNPGSELIKRTSSETNICVYWAFLKLWAMKEFPQTYMSQHLHYLLNIAWMLFITLKAELTPKLIMSMLMMSLLSVYPKTFKYWVGVQRGQSYLWGEGASSALVGHLSTDGVTIKMPYGVDVLHRPALHPIFSYWIG